jgi:archaeal flagellin N-terminal-like domain
MIDKYRDKLDEKGVPPVIGVILLVAVTVALVALATVIVFDIGSEVSDTADATVDIQETSTGISVDVIRNENIDELRVVSPDGSSQTLDSDVGSSHTIEDGGGSYSIVATLEDGSEETIRTITSSADSSVLWNGIL